jgi:hypothetical protein
MTDNEGQDDPRLTEPSWVTRTLWLAPNPVLQIVVIAVITFISLMIFICAGIAQSPVGWTLSGGFAAVAIMITAASISRHLNRRRSRGCDTHQLPAPEQRPTIAIVIFIVSIYSLMLTIGLHVFRNFFAANRPGGLKYNVTLAIAITSSAYMTIHGRSVIQRHFVGRSPNFSVSPAQMLVVIALLLACGAYFGWIMT